MKELKLGTITDLHGNLKVLPKILKKLSENKIDILVLGGDIPYEGEKNSLLKILKKCLKLRKTIFIIPGSHEGFEDYEEQLKKLKSKLIINGAKKLKTKSFGYDFVFLPGSDYLASTGQYVLTYSISNIKKQKNKFKKNSHYFLHKKFRAFQIEKISKLIKNPEKTILISHIPCHFKSKYGIDLAEFGKVLRNFYFKKEHLKFDIFKKSLKEEMHKKNKVSKKYVFTKDAAKLLIRFGYPINIEKKNVGNKYITRLIKQKKIKKFICGHIHESGNRACNSNGMEVKQNKFSEELFLNSGHAEKGYFSIVILKENKARYIKIKV